MSEATVHGVKGPILGVICAVLAVGALGANRAVGRIDTDTLRRLPVEAFPKQVGDWQCVADRPTEKEVQAKIPTARIVDRVYRDSRGREVNLTLLTATDYSDFHDPNICFPGQGFALTGEKRMSIAGNDGKYLVAEREGSRQQVFYWWSGRAAVDTKYGRDQMGKLLAMRDKVIGLQGYSLFVRVIGADGDAGMSALNEFLTESRPAFSALTAEKRS